MEKLNVWKFVALASMLVCVGCASHRHHNDGTGASRSDTSESTDARTGSGTGTGGTEMDSSGSGGAASGAGTGTGGTDTNSTGK